MPEHRSFRASSTAVMSILMILIGIALFVRTLVAGGGALATGLILGVLFVAAGAGRLYLQRHR
jgi:multisubunit Na+/H+ antiporter MnhB subunit